jgi:hypothetical protein
MSEPTHDPELTAVERALAGLAPSAGGLNRDALMFAAGQRSARRGWAWPSAAAGSALTAVVLGALLLFRPAPEPAVRVVFLQPSPAKVETPPTPPDEAPAIAAASPAPRATAPRPETDCLTLRQQVERWGDAGLPAPPLSSAQEQRPGAADPLDLPPDMRADPWLQRRTALLAPGGSL